LNPASAKIKAWRENPCQFVAEVFNCEPDAWQRDALSAVGGQSLMPRRRLALKSCTGAGKSAVLSWIGWHRLLCFAEKGEHPKGAALSGGGRDQLRDNLFSELLKWRERSELLKNTFTHTTERISAVGFSETWFLSARSYAKDADSEAIGRSMSGLHSKFPFILLDEIGDVPISVGQKAEQIFTGGVVDGLIACAGNPVSSQGLLYHIAKNLGSLWNVITITADPDDPNRTTRVDIEHARQQIKIYGRANPWVMSTILGLFPPSSFNSLLSSDDVDAAMGRYIHEEQYKFSQKRLGVDCARFGADRTVLFPRQGRRAFKPVIMRGADTLQIAARVAEAKIKWGSEMEFIDGTGGFGGGVIDFLRQSGSTPMEIHFSSSANDQRYANRRAEMWFNMSKWVKGGGCLPFDADLKKELCAPTYTFQNGKFLLEPKDQIKRRLGFSPDIADSLCLTFAIPDLPTSVGDYGLQFSIMSKENSCDTDFDPFN